MAARTRVGSLGLLILCVACGADPAQAGLDTAAATATATATAASLPAPAGTKLTLVSAASGLALEVGGGSTVSGRPVALAAAGTGAAQQWQLLAVSGDAFALANVVSGKVLDVGGASSRDGAGVLQWEDKGGSNQRWRATAQGDGSYVLTNVHSGKCLDAPAGRGAGTQVIQWTCHGGDNQRWRLAAATAGKAAYTPANLKADLAQVLQSRQGIYSGRPLGNPGNIALWDDAHVLSLYRGLTAAQPFYPDLSLSDLAHLVLAEGAQESTGDYGLQGVSVGFLQVTMRYVGADFRQHGTALVAADGTTVIDPQGTIDPTDPGQSVCMWAWYTRLAVASGESAGEVAAGLTGKAIARDFGNAHMAWLTGPGHDRHTDPGSYRDYHDRIKDYFVQAGFGSAERFEALIDAPVARSVLAFRDPPARGLAF